MKSIVVGAMLLRGINAQLPAAPAVGLPAALPADAPVGLPAAGLPAAGLPAAPSLPAAPAVGVPALAVPAVPVAPIAPVGLPAVPAAISALPSAIADVAAPLLTPGINAPSEAQLLGSNGGNVSPPSAVPSLSLPRGTADVTLDQPTAAVPFGAGTTPGTGISFGPDGWRVDEADVVSALGPGSNFVAPIQPPALAAPSLPAPLGGFNAPQVQPVAPIAGLPSGFPTPPLGGLPRPAPLPGLPSDVATPLFGGLPRPIGGALPSPSSTPSFGGLPRPSLPRPGGQGGFGAFAVPDEGTAPTDPTVADPTVADPTVADPATDGTTTDPPVFLFDTPVEALAVSDTPVVPVDTPAASPVNGLPSRATPVEGLPVDTPAASPVDGTPIETPIASPVDALPVDSPVASPIDSPVASPIEGTPVDTPAASPVEGLPIDTPIAVDTPIASPVDGVPPVESPIASPIEGGVPVDSPIASPIEVEPPVGGTPTPTPGVAPSGIALPIGSNPYVGPFDPYSIYDPNSPYYDPYAQPPGWEGEDNGIYDGEDNYPGKRPVKQPVYDDDEECPSWCITDDDYSHDSYPTPEYDDYSPYETTTTTPYYVDYTPTAKPYQEYEPTTDYAPYPEPTPAYDADAQYYPEPEKNYYPQLKKVRSIVRAVRRQFTWPSAYPQPAYPQPAYSDDDDSGSYDGEDGSIPDWLYEISGAPKKPTAAPKPKPVCPKSCYKPKTSDYGYGTKPARPTYTKTRKGGYKTTDKEDGYYPEPTKDGYYPEPTKDGYYPEPTKDGYYPDTTADGYYPDTTEAPYGGYTSSAWYPAGNSSTGWATGETSVPDDSTTVPDDSTSTADDSTTAPTEPATVEGEPTTLVTYYGAAPYPAETYAAGSDPGSPAGDYTGDTLDSLCPNTCNPFNPAENFCDITTGCATTGGSKYYCACRAGYRADNYNAKDFSKQFKVAGQPYVYLAVSTSCNTPCSDQTCSEVLERSQCK